ncbi:hypothetical protein NS365_04585 [Aureimonas ureilytica]|uniref:Phage gp6-like head-tail connector protein n=1 Tax=Aureimonas ureilytica TaxID=401562 RepID=A0A175RUY1_9HYPH|nr:head-tail connector protein [Aureimonas ureilytica]KTR07337.1 hypothetical protein NS365_04585 [Aureimonas ureilytica]
MRTVVIVPPLAAVSLNEAKRHLRVDWPEDDAFIASLIAAAQGHIDGPEGWLGRSIGLQTLEARLDAFCDAMRLPYEPVVRIVSVRYLDAANVVSAVPVGDYEVRGSLLGPSFGHRWPDALATEEAVRVEFVAGYEVVPAPIRAAILLMVGDLYANRESTAEGTKAPINMPTTVERLLWPYRVWS